MTAARKIISLLFSAPVFFAVAFVLSFYLSNIGEVSLGDLPAPLAAAAIFAVLAATAFRFIFGGPKGDIFSSVFIILFFSFEDIFVAFNKVLVAPLSNYVDLYFLIFLFYLCVLEILFFVVKGTKKELSQLMKFTLVAAVISAAIPLLSIANFESGRSGRAVESLSVLPQADAAYLSDLPDIYYIVPDSYSAPWVIKKYFGYDPEPFVSYLWNKGFCVPEAQTSNYPKTFQSIASTLNMAYLDKLSKYKNSSDQTIVTPMIQSSVVANFLRGIGYDYYQLGSWWDSTSYNPYADGNFTGQKDRGAGIGEFNNAIISSTVIKPLILSLSVIAIGFTNEEKRDRTVYQFNEFPVAAKIKGPKFVFAHIIAPHEPYVFGANCEFIYPKDTYNKSDEENYGNQVNCVNKKLQDAIDSILSNYQEDSRQPIILLQSDEGAPFLRHRVTPVDNWGSASDLLLQQKFPVLSAFYLPGAPCSEIYSGMSSVNSFRVILNSAFGTKMPLLPDKNYIFPDDRHFYDFKDVTSIVGNGIPAD
jgi:hypothetical protein